MIGQEVSQERWIEIPDPVRDIYRLWRPTPLFRARTAREALDTPAHIYYKYEGVSPAGSHKPNTAVAQAFYNKEEGVKGLTTETGAGQWGSSLAMACNFFDLGCEVFMVRISYEQKPYRRSLMQTFGASVTPSPSDQTNAGRSILEQDPESPGSLGIAISEAVEAAATSGGAKKYWLGSVLNHVLMHQTVIGLEALEQVEQAGEYPGRDRRLHRRRLELRRLHAAVHRQEPHRGEADARRRDRADSRSEPDEGEVRLRLRRHGDDDAADQDAHARSLVHPGARARRRDCATTAWRRSSRPCTSRG